MFCENSADGPVKYVHIFVQFLRVMVMMSSTYNKKGERINRSKQPIIVLESLDLSLANSIPPSIFLPHQLHLLPSLLHSVFGTAVPNYALRHGWC